MILGPCACQGCRLPVGWTGQWWANKDGDRHRCGFSVGIDLCRTCGGVIDARDRDVARAVRTHQLSPRHVGAAR